MFVIFTLLFTTVLAHSHEKYIDLLPEDEKQQFLDKVARRIMETVENVEDGNKFSGELTDEQLKGHSRFVQEILRQESELLKKSKAGTKDENNAEENLENMALKIDENDDTIIHATSSDNDKGNLSAKNVKLRNADELFPENSTDFIKVEIVTETALPMQKRSVKSDSESNKKEVIEQLPSKTTKEEELSTDKSKDPEIYTTDFSTQTKEPEDMESTTDFQDVITENMNYTSTMEAETNYKILRAAGSSHENSDLKEENVAETTDGVIQKDSDHIFTREINEPKAQTQVNNTLTEGNSVKTNEYLEDNSTMSSKIDQSNKYNLTDKISPKSIFIDINDYSTSTRAAELNIATIVDKPVTENPVPKVKLTAITATTTVLPALTSKPAQKTNNKKPKKTRIIKKSENTTFISYIASNTLKKVKSKYEVKKKSKPIQKKYDMITTQSDINFLPYRIYEVPRPKSGDPPFLRSPEPMKDSPLFVPVYKFSPNNAYYNPTNRLGPNAVEENSIELDTRPLRGGKNNVGERPVPSEFILQLNNELRKFASYQKRHEEYDVDLPVAAAAAVTNKYSEESSESNETNVADASTFPDSHEKSHPINSMKRGLKTHIQSIRDVLFKHKIFVPNGPEKKEELIQELYGNTDILHKYDKKYKPNAESDKNSQEDAKEIDSDEIYSKKKAPTRLRSRHDPKDDIDIDYYFGRKDHLKDKINNKIKDLHRFRVQNNDNKNKNDNFFILKLVKDKRDSNKNELYSKKIPTKEKILNIVANKVFSNNLQKTQDLHLQSQQKSDVAKVSIYMKALKDLLKQDNKALKQYDWLATTVQIQAALTKLFQLIRTIRETKPIHPADVQLLKYTAFLHNFSLELEGAENFKTQLRKHVNLLPRKKKKRGDKLLQENGLLNRVWLRMRTLLPNLTSVNVLNELNEFLLDVERALQDLHEAITSISQVTHFKHQNWFENLKQLYLTPNEKHIRELLLHISLTRLIELIEQGSENGLEDDFVGYMKTHRTEAKRTLGEMMFVTKILDEIKNHSK